MSEQKQQFYNIKQWKESDRPLEKLMELGSRALTDYELLAVLIGHGNREENAVELCRRILSSVNNDLVQLSRLGCDDLMRFKGIGIAKAVSIVAAMELGRRRQKSKVSERQSLTDRKSTRLNSSHVAISYAVFCLKKKTNTSQTKGDR